MNLLNEVYYNKISEKIFEENLTSIKNLIIEAEKNSITNIRNIENNDFNDFDKKF